MRLRWARRPTVVPFIALLAAFSWGAAVRVALADHYHTNCIAHGLVHGSNTYDGSFHSRVETGCGSVSRRCEIWEGGIYVGGTSVVQATAVCNTWSQSFNYPAAECLGIAKVRGDILAEHPHRAHNWCG